MGFVNNVHNLIMRFSKIINLEIEGFEKSKHQIKGSLNYDTYRGFGLFVNYTGRNIIGDASRFLISIDIAEQPGFRVQYQKNIGE